MAGDNDHGIQRIDAPEMVACMRPLPVTRHPSCYGTGPRCGGAPDLDTLLIRGFVIDIPGYFYEVAIGIAHIERLYRPAGAGAPYRTFDNFYCPCPASGHTFRQWCLRYEAEISGTGHGNGGFRLKLIPLFMQVYLLCAEPQPPPRSPKGYLLHAQHAPVEGTGPRYISYREHQVVQPFDIHPFPPYKTLTVLP